MLICIIVLGHIHLLYTHMQPHPVAHAQNKAADADADADVLAKATYFASNDTQLHR